MRTRSIAALMLAALLAGCPAPPATPPTASPSPTAAPGASPGPSGDGHNSDQSEQTACNLLQGEATAVSATAEASGAPALLEDVAYEVTLPEGPDGREGVLRFEADHAEEMSIYLDQDVLVIVRGPDGEALPGAKIMGSKFCGEVAVHRVYELEPGLHTLEWGPTEAASFKVALSPTHPDGAGAGAH
ncbi:MAG: hypothetical protein ACLGIN_09015 [Candidatus Sericytochromatia bacterium]